MLELKEFVKMVLTDINEAVKEVQSESKIIVPKATLPINTALTKQNPKNKDGKK